MAPIDSSSSLYYVICTKNYVQIVLLKWKHVLVVTVGAGVGCGFVLTVAGGGGSGFVLTFACGGGGGALVV